MSDYPRGKKYPDEEGELSVVMSADIQTGCVRIDFGKPIQWLALDPTIAVEFATLIVGKATEVMALHKPSPLTPAIPHSRS